MIIAMKKYFLLFAFLPFIFGMSDIGAEIERRGVATDFSLNRCKKGCAKTSVACFDNCNRWVFFQQADPFTINACYAHCDKEYYCCDTICEAKSQEQENRPSLLDKWR